MLLVNVYRIVLISRILLCPTNFLVTHLRHRFVSVNFTKFLKNPSNPSLYFQRYITIERHIYFRWCMKTTTNVEDGTFKYVSYQKLLNFLKNEIFSQQSNFFKLCLCLKFHWFSNSDSFEFCLSWNYVISCLSAKFSSSDKSRKKQNSLLKASVTIKISSIPINRKNKFYTPM